MKHAPARRCLSLRPRPQAGARITPNTAHKIVAALTAEGLLEVRPGIGTLAAEAPVATREQRRQLLQDEVEAVVVEARKYGLGLADVQDALTKQWKKLS